MAQAKRKKSYLGLLIAIGTIVILLFILVTAVAIFVLSQQFNAAGSGGQNLLTYTSPLSMIEVERVDPALALASLRVVR